MEADDVEAGSRPPTWRTLSRAASSRFRDAGLPAPDVDARRIVEEASGWEGADLARHMEDSASELTAATWARLVDRRARGEPLQYVLGRWGFRTLDLRVDDRVLVPRPETEQVVEVALEELDRLFTSRDGRGSATSPRLVAADLGTGSGAIALSLVAERPRVEVWATDASLEALDVARANLAGVGSAGARVQLADGEWFDALPGSLRGRIDMVVSNPPYVAAVDELPDEVSQWEPRRALVAGPTGLEAIEEIVLAAPAWLARPGALVLELAPHQAEAARALARRAGFVDVEVRPDLAGRDRVLVARRG